MREIDIGSCPKDERTAVRSSHKLDVEKASKRYEKSVCIRLFHYFMIVEMKGLNPASTDPLPAFEAAPIPQKHRQPIPAAEAAIGAVAPFTTEAVWTQFAPNSRRTQYILFWYIAE